MANSEEDQLDYDLGGEDEFELEIDADDDEIIMNEEFEVHRVDIKRTFKPEPTVQPTPQPMTHPRVQRLKGNQAFRGPRRGPHGHGGVGRLSGLIQNGVVDHHDDQEEDQDVEENDVKIAPESSPPVDEVNLSLDEVIRRRQIPPPPEPFKSPMPPDQENVESSGNVTGRLSNKNLLQHRQINGGTASGSLKRGFSAATTSMRSSATSLTKNVKFTPMSGTRLLANMGVIIVLEVSELPANLEDEHYYHKRRWRACYYDGRVGRSLAGIAEAPRKSLAKEAAALDFLTKLKDGRPDLSPTLRAYEIPYGCRISPSVLGALERLVESLGLGEVSYKQDLVQVKGKDKYQYTITIAENEWTEASYEMKYARYCAAKRAYDDLKCGTGEFPLDNYFSGNKCLKPTKHELIEAEELHVCKATLPQHHNKRKLETLYGRGTVRSKRVKNIVNPTIPKVVSNLREQHETSKSKGSLRGSMCESVASSIIDIL